MNDDQLAETRQSQIGFVFQSFHLVPRLSAYENVELPMVLAGQAPAQRRELGEAALQRVGLGHRSDHRPNQLSGGERQRVAIARAIVMQPKLLLADEPTGNLDSQSGKEIVKLMEDLNGQGLTLLVVTHDPAIGERAGRRLRFRGRAAGQGFVHAHEAAGHQPHGRGVAAALSRADVHDAARDRHWRGCGAGADVPGRGRARLRQRRVSVAGHPPDHRAARGARKPAAADPG